MTDTTNEEGPEENCPPIAPGTYWETRPDGIRPARYASYVCGFCGRSVSTTRRCVICTAALANRNGLVNKSGEDYAHDPTAFSQPDGGR